MRVLVAGDVMLDSYWYGDCTRISPEAPVPVVAVTSSENRLGAAANVARNVKALGADVILLCAIGADPAGAVLKELLYQSGIDLCYKSVEETTNKTRIVSRNHQIVRLDMDHPVPEDVSVYGEFVRELERCDIVILSDYGRGVLHDAEDLIREAHLRRKRVLVDPKGYNYEKYRGAYLVKPNQFELREISGGWDKDDQMNVKAENLRVRYELDALLLTRAAAGMSLYTSTGQDHIVAEAREVFDVSGAGDTAIAALAVALGRGLPLLSACRLANRAAGIVCGRFGTAVATEKEVFDDSSR